MWEPTSTKDEFEALPYEAAKEKWGHKIRRSFTHKALNRLLQGSAADLIKLAMVNLQASGLLDDIPMLLTVHDELCFSIPEGKEQEVKEIERIMTQSIEGLKVPLLVDAEFGPSWGEVH
jgi:DNA polymerase-1